MDLIIADPDQDYTAALAARLQKWQDSSKIDCCHHSQQLHSLIAQRKENIQPTFFLYNSSVFAELVHLSRSKVWPESWQTLPIANTSQLAGEYSRFKPVSQLIEQIKALAAELQTQPAAVGNDNSCIQLAFSFSPDSGMSFYRQRLTDLLMTGCQLVYLPLMPSYQMERVQAATSGPNLSDLLLDLLGDNLACQDLGGYWQPHPDGYLQFRPPQRSDDLITCGPDILRKLILTVKEKLLADPAGRLLVFISCSGLPLAWVAAVAVLCDSLDLELPQGKSFSAAAAQAEAGRLLALLPASCQVQRHYYKEAPDHA